MCESVWLQFELPLEKFTITDSFILGSDKHIHDRDMAWLLKSDGKLDCSLFINFLTKRLVVKGAQSRHLELF